MNEDWKDIVGYEGRYQISNFGRVKSLNSGRMIYLELNPQGYQVVMLHKSGTRRKHPVHRLVAEAFIANPNHYRVVHHKDSNRSNNLVGNLEWCTQSMNVKYAYASGRMIPHCPFGEKAKNAKLRNIDVVEIKKMIAEGILTGVIAKKYGVCKQTIRLIKNNKRWMEERNDYERNEV